MLQFTAATEIRSQQNQKIRLIQSYNCGKVDKNRFRVKLLFAILLKQPIWVELSLSEQTKP